MFQNDTERIDKIINEYQVGNNNDEVDYKAMLEDLRMFNYNNESGGARSERQMLILPTESEYSEPANRSHTPLTILDIQKVPVNKEEEIKSKSSKINRLLKKHFKTQDALTRHLKEKVDVDKNGTIDLNEFQSLIIDTFKDKIEDNTIGKKDVEAFMSNFVYNQYGYTGVYEVAPRVFATVEDQNKIIDHFRKPMPPPTKVNHGLENEEGIDFKNKDELKRVKVLADKIVTKAINASHSKYQ
jgi:hypothetical protein